MRATIEPHSSIESTLENMKSDARLGRNLHKGALDDVLLAVLCSAGYNLRLLVHLLRLYSAYLRLKVGA